ncbi:pyruvate oxidase [Paucilactobacillus kaifaensis]|uniref:pyruvate oxidase n=1 Tax=Paucilactobacillus kaifaensis TaxID=2559921 RepID=UPI0010F619B4|nr:pyruvate oxidase [Paucilactobacillus kaifaensis]
MTTKINAADAMIKVLEDWKIDHIFGLPGGSFDSTMNALFNRQNTMNYIQVRHEETGAIAASGEAKLTGKIGVTFGSAGPGAVHLLNGLYDAKHDHAPVLALVGQVGTDFMNTEYFQELNENPIFADVAVYNRTVMTADQLPAVVDQAISQAYEHSGVAVVTLPKDLGWAQIDDNYVSNAGNYAVTNSYQLPDQDAVKRAVDILANAKKPLIYFGLGAKMAAKELKQLSDQLKIPLMSSALAKGVIADSDPAYMGSAGRVATKPGVEAARSADAILFIGSNFPFAPYFFSADAKFIQVDVKPTNIGKRHHVDVGILADAKTTLAAMVAKTTAADKRPFYDAMLANKKNWIEWLAKFVDEDKQPLNVDSVFDQINRIASDDAIFALDVGNVTIDGVRLLRMKPTQKITTSGWYATMGYALPTAIGAQVSYPNRQVFSISGDGGYTMVMHDILTQVKYQQPIINVVLTNKSLGFIEAEQDDTQQPHSGVDLIDAQFGDAATALGAQGFEVRTLDELKHAFDEAKNATGPVVIDVKIANDRPLPVEQLVLEKDEQHSQADVDAFVKQYRADGLIPINQLLHQYNVE